MDWADYLDKREIFIKEYEYTVLVAHVSQPDQDLALFGPFNGGKEAMDWMEQCVPTGVAITFFPLRKPYKTREKTDFFTPRRMLPKTEYETVQHPSDTMDATNEGEKQ